MSASDFLVELTCSDGSKQRKAFDEGNPAVIIDAELAAQLDQG